MDKMRDKNKDKNKMILPVTIPVTILGPVNTCFAARDGDGFQPEQGTSRAAE
jgi:hypothetical protein